MIFVTVGTQLPFDRLVRAIDDWAAARNRTDIFAQIGPGEYQPRHLKWARFIDAPDFRRHVAEAETVVAHAGMGSIITALEMGKAIVVMPRRADLREHRNDHQLATARHFAAQGRIRVAFDEAELLSKLDVLAHCTAARPRCSATASPELLDALRRFVEGDDPCLAPAFRVARPIAVPVGPVVAGTADDGTMVRESSSRVHS